MLPQRAHSDPKTDVLKEVFGFDGFRPGQEEAVDHLLAGRNVLMVMPTGAGKSMCFQVPALVRGGLTIVVSPLVALMHDQVSALKLAGVAAETINSSKEREENVDTWRRVAAGDIRLLYLAPERLMTERMLAALSKLDVRLIAIDEAHCISQWGPAFRPEYEALAQLRDVFPDAPIAALTATADEATRSDIEQRLFAGRVETLVQGFDRPNIQLTVEIKQDWKKQLLAFVERHEGESGIVYCLSRKKTEEVAEALRSEGVNARAYHAGMAKEDRDANQNAFMTEQGLVMVATIAFGLGIDKADVRFVFHTDLPGSLEAYYQEIGRAGRDGAASEAHMLFGLADIRMRRMFIEQEDAGEDRKRREHQRLNALLGYSETPTCRRQVLLSYFGEPSDPCGNCDTCIDPVSLTDGTEDALKIFAAIKGSGERFGTAHVIDILRGAETEKILTARHDKLTAYGSGTARDKREWQSLIRQLVAGGFLDLDIAGYGGLSVATRAEAVIRGDEAFHYHADHVQSAKPKRKIKAAEAAAELTAPETSLLAALKELRLRLAKERQVPAYVIFPDRTLIDMAKKHPRTRDEFADVNGVGAAKLDDFSETFLAVIAAHEGV